MHNINKRLENIKVPLLVCVCVCACVYVDRTFTGRKSRARQQLDIKRHFIAAQQPEIGLTGAGHIGTNKPKGGAVRFNEQPSQLSATFAALN